VVNIYIAYLIAMVRSRIERSVYHHTGRTVIETTEPSQGFDEEVFSSLTGALKLGLCYRLMGVGLIRMGSRGCDISE
jgi:hypothetical protein